MKLWCAKPKKKASLIRLSLTLRNFFPSGPLPLVIRGLRAFGGSRGHLSLTQSSPSANPELKRKILFRTG